VRDIRLVNLSLLAKWRWRLIQGVEGLWKDVLIEKYGTRVSNLLVEGVGSWPNFMSRWWKDIVHLEEGGGEKWFNVEVIRKVGFGNATSFWKDPWREAIPFSQKYPRLFAISNNKEASVEECRQHNGGGGGCSFEWRRPLFVWEEDLLLSLTEDLEGYRWGNHPDRWVWNLEEEGAFSVKSCYEKLERLSLGEAECGRVESV
jgi:hypothetical protein